jgi:hypothetical protein
MDDRDEGLQVRQQVATGAAVQEREGSVPRAVEGRAGEFGQTGGQGGQDVDVVILIDFPCGQGFGRQFRRQGRRQGGQGEGAAPLILDFPCGQGFGRQFRRQALRQGGQGAGAVILILDFPCGGQGFGQQFRRQEGEQLFKCFSALPLIRVLANIGERLARRPQGMLDEQSREFHRQVGRQAVQAGLDQRAADFIAQVRGFIPLRSGAGVLFSGPGPQAAHVLQENCRLPLFFLHGEPQIAPFVLQRQQAAQRFRFPAPQQVCAQVAQAVALIGAARFPAAQTGQDLLQPAPFAQVVMDNAAVGGLEVTPSFLGTLPAASEFGQ